jgi:hypothetical protein
MIYQKVVLLLCNLYVISIILQRSGCNTSSLELFQNRAQKSLNANSFVRRMLIYQYQDSRSWIVLRADGTTDELVVDLRNDFCVKQVLLAELKAFEAEVLDAAVGATAIVLWLCLLCRANGPRLRRSFGNRKDLLSTNLNKQMLVNRDSGSSVEQ